ncbi:MAG: pilus assembly protein N-terminal domain-containing protein [Caulobacteraceae bacterium]|nr:pilus assembly protein N-terminal domain-containing protein [Caulobacteraceae bacterium]
MRLVLAALLAAAATAAQAQTMTVNLDQSLRLSLPAPARDVVVSNPTVVDVSMLSPTSLLVLGKGYGITNLMVVDAAGRTIIDREVVVGSSDANRVSFYRGPNVTNYACAGRCERTPLPGEVETIYKAHATPYTEHAEQASGAAGKP